MAVRWHLINTQDVFVFAAGLTGSKGHTFAICNSQPAFQRIFASFPSVDGRRDSSLWKR